METAKQVKEARGKRNALLDELRAVIEKRQAITPGMPSIAVPLDKIYAFKKDGETCAVIPIQEVLYLVDDILRG